MDSTRLSLAIGLTLLGACGRAKQEHDFAALRARGEQVMGVNQYTSAHVFEDLPDGVFLILPRDQAPGISEESQVNKIVRVVSTVEYFLK